jgi:hypothetical protein
MIILVDEVQRTTGHAYVETEPLEHQGLGSFPDTSLSPSFLASARGS